MNLHLNKDLFAEMIDTLNVRTGIAVDIIEKDYYVCLILMDIAKKQNETKAYFKGGTAIYKILDEMNRFSEDIDLTVKVLKEDSNTKNRKRLKQSALGYELEGLELLKDETIDNKGSVTGFYRYDSVFDMNQMPLHRAGKIQVESTSFTVSEPTEKYVIAPLIYQLATNREKDILKEKFDLNEFEIEIIKLERMFIDKLFAAEFYYIREMYTDTVKHLYDITNLYRNEKIKEFLKNADEVKRLVEYKRQEELVRKGGIDSKTKIVDFSYFKQEFNDELLKEFDNMQNKYVLNEKYKIDIEEVKKTLNEIVKNENIAEISG